MTEIAGDYLSRVGRTAVAYIERVSIPKADTEPEKLKSRRWRRPPPGRKVLMSPADVLRMTLAQNGVRHPSVLDRYVQEEIFRYGARLRDMTRRLRSAHHELKHVSW
jgi:hypothetical protein